MTKRQISVRTSAGGVPVPAKNVRASEKIGKLFPSLTVVYASDKDVVVELDAVEARDFIAKHIAAGIGYLLEDPETRNVVRS